MRWHALNALVRAYRPTVPLSILATAAGFVGDQSKPQRHGEGKEERDGDDKGGPLPGRRTLVFEGDCAAARGVREGMREAEAWALSCGAVLVDGAFWFGVGVAGVLRVLGGLF